MPISLSSLIQGGNGLLAANNAGTTAGQGIALDRQLAQEQAEQRRQQLVQEALYRRVQQSMLAGNYASQDEARKAAATTAARNAATKESQGPKLSQVHGPDGRVYAFNPQTGQMTPTGTSVGQAPAIQFLVGPQGDVATGNRRTGTVSPTGQSVGTKAPTAAERVAGSQASSVEDSINRLEALARTHPEGARQAMGVIHTQEVLPGAVGRGAAALRSQFTDPAAQEFFSEYNNFLLAATPIYGGVRPTTQLLGLERAATGTGFGSNDWSAAFRHMRARLRDIRAKAGTAAPAAAQPAPTEPNFEKFRHPNE